MYVGHVLLVIKLHESLVLELACNNLSCMNLICTVSCPCLAYFIRAITNLPVAKFLIKAWRWRRRVIISCTSTLGGVHRVEAKK